MRAWSRWWRSGVFLACAAVAAAALGVFGARTSSGRGESARLLVKCEREAVPAVLRALAGNAFKTEGVEVGGVEVWDLDTMARLAPQPAPSPERASPSAEQTIPALPDATRVMQEVLLAVQRLGGGVAPEVLQVEEMIVQPRRATARVIASNPETFDGLRRALAANPYLRGRAADPARAIEMGAQQRLPDGRYRQALSLRFKEEAAGGGPAGPSSASIDMRVVRRMTQDLGLQVLYAGPERDDPNRSRGYRTIAREFTLAPTTLGTLTRFLARVGADPAGYTVTELRWKREGPKAAEAQDGTDAVRKPVFLLAVRRPLGR